jgi:ABC-type uncharacterized transport system substrate-binding protein
MCSYEAVFLTFKIETFMCRSSQTLFNTLLFVAFIPKTPVFITRYSWVKQGNTICKTMNKHSTGFQPAASILSVNHRMQKNPAQDLRFARR